MCGGQGSAHGGSRVTDRREVNRRITSGPSAKNHQVSWWPGGEGVKPLLLTCFYRWTG